MKERGQNRKSLYGSLIVAGLVVLAGVIFSVQWIFQKATPSIEVIALLPGAASIDTRTPVWIAGQQVGTIKAINFRGLQTDSATRLAVSLQIPRKHAEQVRKDATVRITSSQLVGEPVIDINPGSPTAPPIQAGDTLRMSASGTLEGVMDKADTLTTQFDKLIVALRSVENGAHRGSTRMAQLQKNLGGVMTEFRDFSRAMNQPAVNRAKADLQAALRRMQSQNAELQTALKQAISRSGPAQADVRAQLKSLMARADTISTVIATLRSRMTENGGGLLVRAQKDSAIVKALHRATVQLDSLMAETTRNPLRFWF